MAVAAMKKDYRPTSEPVADRSCARCAHYRRAEFGLVGHFCERPQLGSTRDLVIGADMPNRRDAYCERSGGVSAIGEDQCCPEGKFWQHSGF